MNSERSHLAVYFPVFILFILSLACGQSTAAIPTATLTTLPSAFPPTTAVAIPTTEAPALSNTQISPGVTTGASSRVLEVGGVNRSYRLYVPASYDPNRPIPAVLIFHGFDLDGEEMVRITGFDAQAEAGGFIAVYPDGTGSKKAWNGGGCCGEAAARRVDDVGFVSALIDELAKVVNLDRKQIFATGFSNGAIMAYRLACDLSDQIAAIGPVGAAQQTLTCQPTRPVPIIHFHGTDDRLNPYEGGAIPGSPLKFTPVEDTIQWWVTHNGCPEQAQETQAGNIVHRIYGPCSQAATVELYKIIGGEHAWPGGEAVSVHIGQPTHEISATPLMWEFFLAHPMP